MNENFTGVTWAFLFPCLSLSRWSTYTLHLAEAILLYRTDAEQISFEVFSWNFLYTLRTIRDYSVSFVPKYPKNNATLTFILTVLFVANLYIMNTIKPNQKHKKQTNKQIIWFLAMKFDLVFVIHGTRYYCLFIFQTRRNTNKILLDGFIILFYAKKSVYHMCSIMIPVVT